MGKTKTIRGMVMCLLAAACCGRSSDERPGTTVGQQGAGTEPVIAVREAVTASTSLSAALNGRIALTGSAGDTIAEPIRGDWSVGDDGAGYYQVPLWLPDGVAGMQPSLTIAYGSRAAPGLLGPRWTIAGISRIARCPMALPGEGYKESVNYGSGDEYCLDGEHLVRVAGTPGLNGEEFRSKKNPFAKIVANVDASNRTSFTVFQPDGHIFYYGRSDASRLWGHAGSYPNATVSPGSHEVLAWYVDKTADRFNNSILYTYVATSAPTTIHTTELQPSQILWGGTGDTPGQRSVTFNYDSPPSAFVASAHERFVAGMGILPAPFVTSIDIAGPAGGTGALPILKTYNFTYSQPTMTGERLLATIGECDAIGVCKLPTNVTWEPGIWYMVANDLTANAGISDMVVKNAGPMTVTNPFQKITVGDLNGDGRDDIVYRANMPTTGLYSTCLGWAERLGGVADGSPGAGYFGSAGTENATHNADVHCQAAQGTPSGAYPNPADLLVQQLDATDKPETLLAADSGVGDGSVLSGPYTAYFPTGAYPYENGQLIRNVPDLAIGDVDGDGALEVMQWSSNPLTALWAGSLSTTGTGFQTTLRSVPALQTLFPSCAPGSPIVTGFTAVDLDGDGVVEVLRDLSCTSLTQYATALTTRGVTYPDPIVMPPNNPAVLRGVTIAPLRWFMDFNGDGLPDLVYVLTTDPTTIRSRINTGRGFLPEVAFPMSNVIDQIGPGWLSGFESGVRVADVDGDGRQDLVLVDPGVSGGGVGANYARVTARALISDGTGGFGGRNLQQVAIGDPADGWVEPHSAAAGTHGYNSSVVLDYNGDGLPDIAQVQGGHLWLYTRQGKMPDVVTNIAEGTGRTIAVTYSNPDDTSTFTADSSACNANNQSVATCALRAVHAMSIVASDKISGGGTTIARSYKYTGAVSSRQGDGFLGFEKREIFGPAPSEHTTITYSPADAKTFATQVGTAGLFTYAFESALAPMTAVTEWVTTDVTHPHHYSYKSYAYLTNGTVAAPAADHSRFSYWHLLNQSTTIAYDSSATGALPTDSGVRTLSDTVESYGYDSYGNLTSKTVTSKDGTGASMQSDTDTWTFDPADTTNWIVAKINKHTSQSTASSSTVLRTTGYATDPATGAIVSVEQEPTGDSTVHVLRCIGRDSRGRFTSILARTTGTCGTTPPADARQTTFAYEDADGVYVTTTTNAAGNKTRDWRHPGLGVLVESDDSNGSASTTSYDTFGRIVGQTEITGASSTVTYSKNAPAGQGSSYTILPEGKSTRAINVVVDALGNESARTWPIDAGKSLKHSKVHDYASRLTQRTTYSNTTVLNTETFNYDDMGRLTSSCHQASDGTNHCVTETYDGASMTRTDESGRVTTRILDAMGRLSKQRAQISTGLSDATFSYGPFDALVDEAVEDGSGWTTMTYDVLGRQTSLWRKGTAGPRMTMYNPYGEVVVSWKQDYSSGAQEETISYGRDGLGRIIYQNSQAGIGANAPPALNRFFFWDKTATGAAAPYAIGKLVDVHDYSFNVNTHFDYDGTTGEVKAKTWTISNGLLQGTTQTYALGYAYDSQGRLDTLSYPTLPDETQPFAVKYAYDAYTGTTASLTDTSNTARPLWASKTRNEWGNPTQENMSFGAGTTITSSRMKTYYSPTGALKNSTICSYQDSAYLTAGCGGGALESYTYQADGLPSTFRHPNSLTLTFDYDNLGRLTTWHDSFDAQPVVTYQYDSDGNLTNRAWSTSSSVYGTRSETVTYGATFDTNGVMTSRTLADQGILVNSPSQVVTSTYGVDPFLRVTSTPALASIGYTADDQFGTVTESSGMRDVILYDGMGHRVMTFFGDQTQSNSWYRVTLDSLFELGGGKAYTAGPYGSFRLLVDGRVVGDVWRKGTGAARTANFYLADRAGTVVAEVAGNSLASAHVRDSFDPFGERYMPGIPYLGADNSGDGTGPSSRYGYAGHDQDTFYPASPSFGREGWGTVDMLARNYDPRLGRFLTPDSIIPNAADRRDYNPFAYAHNQPTALSDPSGHDPGAEGNNGNNGAGGQGGGAGGQGGGGGPGDGAGGAGGQGGNPSGGGEGTGGGDTPGAGGAGGAGGSPGDQGTDVGQGNAGGRNGGGAAQEPDSDDDWAGLPAPYECSGCTFETVIVAPKPAAAVNPAPPGAAVPTTSTPTNVSISGGVGTGNNNNTASGLSGAKWVQKVFGALSGGFKYFTTDSDVQGMLGAAQRKATIFGDAITGIKIGSEGSDQRGQDLAGWAGSKVAGAVASDATSAGATAAADAAAAGTLMAGGSVDAALGAGVAASAGARLLAGGLVGYFGTQAGMAIYNVLGWLDDHGLLSSGP